MSVTLHFQSTGTVPARAEPSRMVGGAMTIGRSDQNDLVLPDSDKTISSRHCAIEDQDGNIVVIDFSTNGTFLNYGKSPLGAVPTPLNDGDILSIGHYELLVKIVQSDVGGGLADPFADIPPIPAARIPDPGPAAMLDPLDDGDDFLDDLLGAPTAGPSGVKRDVLGDDGLLPPLGDQDDFLAPAPEPDRPAQSSNSSSMSDVIRTPAPATSMIPDDWDLDMPAEASDPFVELDEPFSPASAPASSVEIPEDADFGLEADLPQDDPVAPAPIPSASPEPTAPTPAGPDHAARAFLAALGADDLDIPDAELHDTMVRMGEVMNTMITGVREILMTRQSIKSEFRMTQTVISAGANNPLKFSVSVEQAINAMVKPAVRGYLPAPVAATQALDDIKAHEVATMTGMEAALKGVLARLDPKLLTERIAADSSLRSVLTNKKARYWDVFSAQYAEISDQAENDFHDLFSKEFSRAYQAQLERLKSK